MLTADTLRHRYKKIPSQEPLAKIFERGSFHSAPQEICTQVVDAWESSATIAQRVLVDGGLNELDARVVHGFLEARRGIVPVAFKARFSQQVAASDRACDYQLLDDSQLRPISLDVERYCALRANQRQAMPQSVVEQVTGYFSKKQTQAATRAGILDDALVQLSHASWQEVHEMLCEGSKNGAVRNMKYSLEGNPIQATLVSLEHLDVLADVISGIHKYLPVAVMRVLSDLGLDRKSLVVDHLVVIYAEYQRERHLKRAETLAAQLGEMQAKRAAMPHCDAVPAGFDEAMGVLCANFSESLRIAASYGNLFSQATDVQGKIFCKQVERHDLVDIFGAAAEKNFADPGYRAAWVRGHPRVKALDEDIARLIHNKKEERRG